MFWILFFLAILVGLVFLYPYATSHWIDDLLAGLAKRRYRQREQYLHELHESIKDLKKYVAASGVDSSTKDHLTQMCDDYERDLRSDVLNAGYE
jgi:hypothetical protein